MTPESKVKKFVTDRMKSWFPGIWIYAPPGIGLFGRNGIPDRFFLWKGIFIAIETKADDNEPTDLQMKRLKEIQANGGISAVVVGKDERKMRMIRDAILRRVQLADEVGSAVRPPETDGGVLPPEQTGVRPV